MNAVVRLKDRASSLSEYWFPKVVGEINDCYAKVAKPKGSLAWHKHDNEDELFLVLEGCLAIEMEDRRVELEAGEMFIVPKGVLHNPVTEGCTVFLLEPKATQHTGDLQIAATRSIKDQLKPS